MDTTTRLKNVPLFAGLAPENLARVAEIAARQLYPKGSLLCRAEEYGETLYIVDSGEAILRQTDMRGLERPVSYLREGDSIGDDALLLEDVYGSCVQATTRLEVLCIHKKDFELLIQQHPQIEKQLRVRPLIRERLQARNLPRQQNDEPSLLLRKRHWFVLVRTLPLALLALLLLALVALGLRWLGMAMSPPITLLFLTLIPVCIVIWFLIDWQNDFCLVTAKRILHREKVLLLYETWDEAPLVKVQNINIRRGFLGRILGFGTMYIQTASARGTMVLDHLPDPEGMQEIIFKQARYLQSRAVQTDRAEVHQELLQQIGTAKAEEEPPVPPPPPQEPPKKTGHLAGLLPSRPLLRLRYEQANQITWRKHWIFLLKRIYLALPVFLLINAAIIAIGLYDRLAPYRLSLLLGFFVLWVASLFWLWWEVTDWGNDEYIVTDRLIIDVEKKPLFFAEERTQATLDMIQSISLRMPGLLANILNYGDVLIQTAGSIGTFTFDGVSNPAEVQREISRRVEAYQEARQRRDREQRKAELSTWFQVYDELRPSSQPPANG